jgi:hypothetical protein
MKIINTISKSKDGNSMEVITDDGVTRHLKKSGSVWKYLYKLETTEDGNVKEIFKTLEVNK